MIIIPFASSFWGRKKVKWGDVRCVAKHIRFPLGFYLFFSIYLLVFIFFSLFYLVKCFTGSLIIKVPFTSNKRARIGTGEKSVEITKYSVQETIAKCDGVEEGASRPAKTTRWIIMNPDYFVHRDMGWTVKTSVVTCDVPSLRKKPNFLFIFYLFGIFTKKNDEFR
jgi:hypothetical protein